MDKICLKFFADVLYIKGFLLYDEYEDIMEVESIDDLDVIVDKMLKEEYNPKRGEGYVLYEYMSERIN